MNDQPIQEMNAQAEEAQPVRRRRRSERYEHPTESEERKNGIASDGEDSQRTEINGTAPDGENSRRTEEKAPEEPPEGARIRIQGADGKKGQPNRISADDPGIRGEIVNPLRDLANRPSSLAAGGSSRAKALNPERKPAAQRNPETWQKLEQSGYPRATLSAASHNRDVTTRVGYAPGRMEETDSQRTAAAGRADASGGRGTPIRPIRVKEYPENRYQQESQKPEPPMKNSRQKKKGGRRGMRVILILATLLIFAVAALMLLPEDNALKRSVLKLAGKHPESEATASPAPDPVYVFNVSGHENQTAPADITFSVTTGKSVTAVRLTDEDGQEIVTSVTLGDNANDNAWILTMHTDDGYDGEAHLQIREETEEWQDTAYSALVQVISRPAADNAREPASAGTENEGETQVGVMLQPTEAESENSQNRETEPEDSRPDENEAEGTEPGLAGETESGAVPYGTDAIPEETEEDGGDAESVWIEEEVLPDETEEENLTDFDGEAEAPNPEEAEPTAAPTAEPTPEPTPELTEEPTPTPALTASAALEADPELISTSIVYNGSKKVSEYSRAAKEMIHMPAGGQYSKKNMGVLTFRGDAFRQNAAAGTVRSAKELSMVWQVEAGSARGASTTYYGIGWTGQPAIVKWSKEVREKSGLYETKLEKVGLKEVIIAGMDGVIYFLDLDDGSLTRNNIKLGYPMKGTPSVHPSGFPFMTVGQYARKMKSRTGTIGLRQYNLYNGKEMSLIDGFDGKMHRGFNNVGSFETSALIDRTSDTMITAASNGLLYLVSLNSDFDYQAGTYRQSGASTVVLKTRTRAEKKESYTAVESSPAMYDKYVFYADMGGVLRCVDTNSLKTVWAVETGDAVEATLALNLNDTGGLDLYTGNMLINRNKGAAQIRGYDALTGTEKWMTEIPVKKDTKTKKGVGVKASPLVGQNQLKDLVYFTVTGLSEDGKSQMRLAEDTQAVLVALDQKTGSIVWTRGLTGRSESSPVAVYDEKGQGWVIQASGDGEILLLEGLTGKIVHQLTVEGEIEASPAVYNDMLVIGTTGKDSSYIYGIRIQ